VYGKTPSKTVAEMPAKWGYFERRIVVRFNG
jgi:hypothetical protein